jgi:hypothetical protein
VDLDPGQPNECGSGFGFITLILRAPETVPTTFIPDMVLISVAKIGVIWYLLLILTTVNMYSYAIVLFQLENLWTRISGTRQRIPEVLGMMTTVWSMRPTLTSLTLAV